MQVFYVESSCPEIDRKLKKIPHIKMDHIYHFQLFKTYEEVMEYIIYQWAVFVKKHGMETNTPLPEPSDVTGGIGYDFCTNDDQPTEEMEFHAIGEIFLANASEFASKLTT